MSNPLTVMSKNDAPPAEVFNPPAKLAKLVKDDVPPVTFIPDENEADVPLSAAIVVTPRLVGPAVEVRPPRNVLNSVWLVVPVKFAEVPVMAPIVEAPSVVDPAVEVSPAVKFPDVLVIAPVVVAPSVVGPSVDVRPSLKVAEVPVMAPMVVWPKLEGPAVEVKPPAPMLVGVLPVTDKPLPNVPRDEKLVVPENAALFPAIPPTIVSAVPFVELTRTVGAVMSPPTYVKFVSVPTVGVADPKGIVASGMDKRSSMYAFEAASVGSVGGGSPVILSLFSVIVLPFPLSITIEPITVMAFSVVQAKTTGLTNSTMSRTY